MPLPLPDDPKDIVSLSDWLELTALTAADRNASLGDLEDAIQMLLDKETALEVLPEVSIELQRRADACEEAYPFRRASSSLLQTRGEAIDYIPYVFCLILSYCGWVQKKGAAVNPWHLFEDLSCIAAKEFTGGEVYKIGTSRTGTDGSSVPFDQAVAKLTSRIGEGVGFRSHTTLRPRDDKVDLVAWRHFLDARESKLILFGQCAAGKDWVEKLSELDASAFWDEWMEEGKVSPLIRSFFMPHRVYDDERWKYYARRGGILFDRCRVSYYASRNISEAQADSRYLSWCSGVLDIS